MGLFSKSPAELYKEAYALMDNKSTLEKGWEKMQKAAEKGDRMAQCTVASKYFSGNDDLHVASNLQKAAAWYEKSAEQFFPYAMSMMAYLNYNGMGVKKSQPGCLAWLQFMIRKGLGDTKLFWAVKERDENGDEIPFTARELNSRLSDTWAETLDPEELYEYGRYFDAFTGLGVNADDVDFGGIKKDDSQAAFWYMHAALKGNADAQNCIAIAFQLGKGGLDKDIFVASEWYIKAAKQGHKKALETLGKLCENALVGSHIQAVDKELYLALRKKNADDVESFVDDLLASAEFK